MKKITLAAATLLLLGCVGIKYIPVDIEPITKTFKVEKLKNDLFVISNNWMVETFVDAKSVIQFSDKESGTITGKYLFKSFGIQPGTGRADELYAIIKIRVKDSTAQIKIDPAEFFSNPSKYIPVNSRYTEEDAREQVQIILNSFEVYINNEEESW